MWSWWCHPSDNSTYEVISDFVIAKWITLNSYERWYQWIENQVVGMYTWQRWLGYYILLPLTESPETVHSAWTQLSPMDGVVGNKTSYIKKKCYWNRCTKTWECMFMYIYLCSGINGASVFTTFWLDFRTVQRVLY